MISKKLSTFSIILLIVAGLLLLISIFLPWWQMMFYAPQYPEGLLIAVYPYKLEGKIDIVNNLNHYIGMANFSKETFPELIFLPYLIGGVVLLIFLSAILRSKKLLNGILVGLITGGAIGIYDIHHRLKEFGTNLDPRAPITLDPFIPPVIGKNTIANFVTYSSFSYGSLLLGIAFILLLIPLWKERKR